MYFYSILRSKDTRILFPLHYFLAFYDFYLNYLIIFYLHSLLIKILSKDWVTAILFFYIL